MSPAAHLPLAASGSFLVSPNIGMLIWTLVSFLIVMVILAKWVFPAIGQALDKRAQTISGEIDAATKLRTDAEAVLADYRERLAQARTQADEIVSRARSAGEAHHKQVIEEARAERERLLEQTRRDVEAEARRAIDEIRSEVAALTVLATEKVTRRALSADDQKRLVADALSELDFSALVGSES